MPRRSPAAISDLWSSPREPLCLVDADVNGAVVVEVGASLDVEDSTVAGAITATTPAGIRLCTSSIGGGVNVQQATGLVIIGDPGDAACAPNSIDGTLQLENNSGGVEAIDNTVGNLLALDNRGPGPFPGDQTTIAGNVIVH